MRSSKCFTGKIYRYSTTSVCEATGAYVWAVAMVPTEKLDDKIRRVF